MFLEDQLKNVAVEQKIIALVQSLKRDLNKIVKFINDWHKIHLDGTISISEFKTETISSLESFRKLSGELVYKYSGEPKNIIELGFFKNYQDAKLFIYDNGTIVLQYKADGDIHDEIVHNILDVLDKELKIAKGDYTK